MREVRSIDAAVARILGQFPEISDRFSVSVTATADILSDDTGSAKSLAPRDSRYMAFISYSHRDEQWCKWLHQSLEGFRVPRELVGRENAWGEVPPRVFPVFRDREELSASSELSDSIRAALHESRFLLVICSRAAAKSFWVNQEIKLFKSVAGSRRVLCIIVDGEPHASNPDDECFPEAVKYEVTNTGEMTEVPCEPMAADARVHGDGKVSAKLKVLAAVLGVRYDDLRQREKVRERQQRVRSVVLLTCALLIVGAVFGVYRWRMLQERNREVALNLVDALAASGTEGASEIVAKLGPYRDVIAADMVHRYEHADESSGAKFRLGLALAPSDRSALGYVQDYSLGLSPREVAAIGPLLAPVESQLADGYAASLKNPSLGPGLRLVAGCLHSVVASDDETWDSSGVASDIAGAMTRVDPADVEPVTRLLLAHRARLIPPLRAIYIDKTQGEIQRLFAKAYLSEYCKESPPQLFELLIDSPPEYFDEFFQLLSKYREDARRLALACLDYDIGESESDESRISRQANVAILLLRLGNETASWPILKRSPNPSIRTHLIHWMAVNGVNPEILIAQYRREPDAGVRSGILLALGEYTEKQLPTTVRDDLSQELLPHYRNDPDAGLHGALDWLLSRWGHQDKLKRIDDELRGKPVDERQWLVNTLGQTFAIIQGGTFRKGSPEWESSRAADECQHTVRIDRRYCLCVTGVTQRQWAEYPYSSPEWPADGPNVGELIRGPSALMKGVTWYEAARFCNWLSAKEGLPASEWCFIPNDNGEYSEGMHVAPDFLSRTGYRMATDAEWEYACRAGTYSKAHWGNPQTFLDRYAYIDKEGITYPCAQKKPNDLGLFDLMGNGHDWVIDLDLFRFRDEHPNLMSSGEKSMLEAIEKGGEIDDRPTLQPVQDTRSRKFRGYCATEKGARSGYTNSCHPNDRLLEINLGIRLARTLRRAAN